MSLTDHLDLTAIADLRVGGRGGKESVLGPMLCGWRRVSAALYDYEIDTLTDVVRVEVKKQADLQWFDVGKYFNLSPGDRTI